MFTLPQFRAFLAVVDTGSLKTAAGQLDRSPSAISMILKQMEERIGGELFEGDRKARLTSLGRLIANEARGLLDHNDRVVETIKSAASGSHGRLDVACVPSVAVGFMPDVVASLWEKYPTLVVNVRDMDSRSVTEAVAAGTVEVGFGMAPAHAGDLVCTPLFSDPIDLVCAKGDPLCRRGRPIPWPAVAERPYLGNGTDASIRSEAFNAIRRKQRAYIPNVISLLTLVRQKVGVTVLPRLSRLQSGPEIVFLPLADAQARRTVCEIHRSDRRMSRNAQLFVTSLKSIIARRKTELGIQPSAD